MYLTSRWRLCFRAASVAGLTIVGASCGDSTGPSKTKNRPVLTTHLDSIFAIEETVRLTSQPADVVWASRDVSVARVSQDGIVTAKSVGDTWVLVVSDDGGADSTHIVVRQRIASIAITPAAIARPLGRTQQFQAQAFDGKAHTIPNVSFSWSVEGSAATIEATGLATARAQGVATVRATANGVTGTAQLTVGTLPSLRFNLDTIDVGVGQIAGGELPPPRLIADSISDGEVIVANLSLASPSLATVPATVIVPQANGGHISDIFPVVGTALGTTQLTASAPKYESAAVVVRVSSPRLQIGGTTALTTSGGLGLLHVTAADSLGKAHPLVQPLVIHLRSTAPTVATPDVADVTQGTDGSWVNTSVRAVASGQAWIVATASGYWADSMLITVTGPKLRFTSFDGSDVSETSVGAAEQYYGNLLLAACCQPIDLAVTLTQRRADALRIPHSLVIPPNSNFRIQIPATGLVPATDTIIATAPGYLPDTLIFHVTTPMYKLDPYPLTPTVGNPFSLVAYVADSLGNQHFPASGEAKVLITSSNPAVLRPSLDTMTIDNSTGGSGYFRIDVMGAGTATLTLTDPLGIARSVTTSAITVPPTKFIVSGAEYDTGPSTVGMHQLTFASVHLATGGRYGPPIQIHSTDPTIVRVVESTVTIDPNSANARINVVGGEREGTAFIVASGAGIDSDSLPIQVGKPGVVVTISTFSDDQFRIFNGLDLRITDQVGRVHGASEDVVFRIVSTNPGVVTADSTTLTVRTGEYHSSPTPIRYVNSGTAAFKAIDDRLVPYAYPPAASGIIQVVKQP